MIGHVTHVELSPTPYYILNYILKKKVPVMAEQIYERAIIELIDLLVGVVKPEIKSVSVKCFAKKLIGKDTLCLGNDDEKTRTLVLAVCAQIRVNSEAYCTFLNVLQECNFANVVKMVQDKVKSIHDPPKSRGGENPSTEGTERTSSQEPLQALNEAQGSDNNSDDEFITVVKQGCCEIIEDLKRQLKIKKHEKENLTKQVKEKEKELQQEVEKRKELKEYYSEHIKKLKADKEQIVKEYKQKLKEKEDLLKQQSEKSKNEVQELTKRINTLQVELQKKKEIAETAERERKEYEDKLKKQNKELEKVELEKQVFELKKKIEYGEKITQLEHTIKDLECQIQLQVQQAETERKIAEVEKEKKYEHDIKDLEYQLKLQALQGEADRKIAEVEKEKAYIRGKYDEQRARTTPEFQSCIETASSPGDVHTSSYSVVTVEQSKITAIKKNQH